MDQLITIGQIDASDTLGSSLHNAAYLGKKKNLKKALDKGIHVDYPNDEGQTPLFTAAYGGHETVVRYLLSAGADANEKTNLGLTAIHAACFSGHLKIVMKLLQAGGDLRLHDYQGRSAKDWAMLNPNPKKRMKILEFLDKTRMFAMSSSGQDLLLNKASSKTLHRAHHRRNTVTNIIRNKIGKPSIHGNLEKMATSQHTLGFGHVYSHGHDTSGFMSAIPFVNENSLKHDQNGETFDNGGFCVMESVWWDYTKVTAKKLRDDIDPYTGGVVDLLINEIEHIGKLRHPNIVTLMGVCQASNLDGLYLIYETIPIGSLFNYMHHQLRRLPTEMIQEISLQICDAIIFIHLRGLVHCSITSHAISIIHPHLFKLGNFEYMTEASKCEWGKKNAVANNTAENAVYNWMAPEVMLAMPPSFYCDMYSYCVILWEMFHGDIPWANECAESIKAHYSRGKGLKMMHGKILEYFKIILEYGLQQEPTNRKMTFLHVRDFLMVAPKDAKHYMRTRLKHLHYSDDDTDPSSSRLDTSRQDSIPHSHQSYQQHQGSTSRNIDNAMMKGQMNDRERYGNRREMNRHEYQNRQEINNNHEHHRNLESNSPQKYPTERLHQMKYEQSDDHGFRRNQEHVKPRGHHHKHQHLQSESGRTEMMHRSPERKHYDDRRAATEPRYRNQSGNHSDVRQPTQQLTYGLDGLKWGNFPQDVGEEFIYTVQVKKEESPKKASAPFLSTSSDENTLAAPRGRAATKYLVFTDSETSQDTSSQTEYTTEPTTSESSQHARGRSLERKTSSMGNFSFLSLNNHQRTRSAGAKPANHGHYELVAEEYTTQGKLTTAGSLYSLYNDHSPDKPLGQIEDRQKYSTFPRRAFTFPNTETEATEEGISKSVRDLAKLFQQQIAEHSHNQAVLDGTVNREHSTEKLDQSKSNKTTPHKDKSNNKVSDTGNHACTPKKVSVMKELVDSHPSAETSKIATTDNSISESDSTCTFSTNGSSDSECISQWVDYELHKIKRKLSQEMMMKQRSPVRVQSPVLFDSPDDTTSKVNQQIDNKQANRLYFSDSEGSDTNTGVKDTHQCKGDHNEDNTEECFFDDELYLGTSNSDLDIRSCDIGQTMSGSISNLPMTSIMKKTESPSKPAKSVARSNTSDQSKKKIRRIPRRVPHSCSQLMSEPRRDEGTYANVMTIRSSIDEVGKHHVTHKIKNLKTGGSSTLLNERVTGNRVVTVFKA